MKYTNVSLCSFGYELPPNVVSSADLEKRLAPLYDVLHFQKGQLESLTGIRERRFWDPGFRMAEGAILAGEKAIAAASIDPQSIQMLVYGGVCRDNLEPATACAVSDGLGLGPDTLVYDVSNACLGVLNGLVQVANAIELGQISAGLVVSCESAREIVDSTIQRMLAAGSMDIFKQTVATLTGGSGAVAVLLTKMSLSHQKHRLLGGAGRCATEHHGLCTWGPDSGISTVGNQIMNTDSVGVLKHGVALGIETYRAFRTTLSLTETQPDKIVCHQVGSTHQDTILKSIDIPSQRDFTTFQYLGNIGTVSLPITAAIAAERDFFKANDMVGMLGIGSGLNCLMLGIRW